MCNWTRYLFVCSKTFHFNLTLQEYCILLQLTCKSQHIIIISGALASLDICQNIIHQMQFLEWTIFPQFSPSKMLHHTMIYTVPIHLIGVFNFWGVWLTYPKWKSVVYAPMGVHKIPYREWVFIKLSTWGIPKLLIFKSVCVYWNEVWIWWIPLFMMMIFNDSCGLSS